MGPKSQATLSIQHRSAIQCILNPLSVFFSPPSPRYTAGERNLQVLPSLIWDRPWFPRAEGASLEDLSCLHNSPSTCSCICHQPHSISTNPVPPSSAHKANASSGHRAPICKGMEVKHCFELTQRGQLWDRSQAGLRQISLYVTIRPAQIRAE